MFVAGRSSYPRGGGWSQARSDGVPSRSLSKVDNGRRSELLPLPRQQRQTVVPHATSQDRRGDRDHGGAEDMALSGRTSIRIRLCCPSRTRSDGICKEGDIVGGSTRGREGREPTSRRDARWKRCLGGLHFRARWAAKLQLALGCGWSREGFGKMCALLNVNCR